MDIFTKTLYTIINGEIVYRAKEYINKNHIKAVLKYLSALFGQYGCYNYIISVFFKHL